MIFLQNRVVYPFTKNSGDYAPEAKAVSLWHDLFLSDLFL